MVNKVLYKKWKERKQMKDSENKSKEAEGPRDAT